MIANLELFNRLFEYSQSVIGFDTYDSLPMKDVPYPFIVLDSLEENPVNLKTNFFGTGAITIHVWGNSDMRMEVATALEKLLSLQTVESDHYIFKARLNQSNSQLLNDTSVANTTLIHGMATLVFDWYKK